MAGKSRLSHMEQQWVEDLVGDLCRSASVNIREEAYRQAAWVAFLDCRRAWRGAYGDAFWNQAVQEMDLAIRAEKAIRDKHLFQELSLNKPVSPESETPYLDFLPGACGDCSNRVAFYDFLDRLPQGQHQLSSSVLQGYTPGEICSHFRWTLEEYLSHLEGLQDALLRYEAI